MIGEVLIVLCQGFTDSGQPAMIKGEVVRTTVKCSNYNSCSNALEVLFDKQGPTVIMYESDCLYQNLKETK
jgi:hypothetical protein